MKSVICKTTLIVASALLAFNALGCNTVEGAGKDTENLGESVQHAADRNK